MKKIKVERQRRKIRQRINVVESRKSSAQGIREHLDVIFVSEPGNLLLVTNSGLHYCCTPVVITLPTQINQYTMYKNHTLYNVKFLWCM